VEPYFPFILVLVAWIFSVCLHEFGHAVVAYFGGDTSVKEKGYLTMNPLKYTHPVYSFAMPIVFLLLGGIGLPGGAVYINDHLLKSPKWRSACSLAGPAMNLLLAALLAIPFHLNIFDPANPTILASSLAFLVLLQMTAVVFNLLPIPSLDGFGALAPWLPLRWVEFSRAYGGMIFLFFLVVMWNSPVLSGMFWMASLLLTKMVGVPPNLPARGYDLFQFW